MLSGYTRGYAYPRGTSVWVGYTDPKTGLAIQRPIHPAIKLESPVRKRNGRYQWPVNVRVKIQEFFSSLQNDGEAFLKELDGNSLLISELLNRYMALYQYEGKTAEQYRMAVKHFIRFMGDMRVSGITEVTISDFTKRMRESGYRKLVREKTPFMGEKEKKSRQRFLYTTHEVRTEYSQNSINHYHRALKTMFAAAVLKGWMPQQPFADRKIMVKPDAPDIRVFSQEQVAEILRRATLARMSNPTHPEYDDAFRFVLMTGFRHGELLAMTWDDVEFDKSRIRLFNKKEKRWDYFPMPEGSKLHRFMKALPHKHGNKVWRWMRTGQLQRAMNSILRDMGLKLTKGQSDETGYCIHTLRKTFITNLVLSGVRPEVTKRLARHKKYSTTEKYYIAFGMENFLEGIQSFDNGALASLL